MPALFFPNLDALRLVLASGIVPPAVARAPGRAGFDDHGRLWLEPAELPPREALAAMARLGVRVHGDAGIPTEPAGCWAELLPLRPTAPAPAALLLFELPDAHLSPFVAEVRRLSRGPVGVRLLAVESGPGRAWVAVHSPPAGLVLRCQEPDSAVEAFAEHAAGVWVRVGWEHPLPDHLAVADDTLLLLRPPRAVAVRPGPVPVPAPEEFRLPPGTVIRPAAAAPAHVPVRFTLGRGRATPREALWVFAAAQVAEFWDFCRTADEALVRRFEVATVTAGADERVVLRCPAGKKAAVPPVSAAGYYPDPRAGGLYVPAGRVLRPTIRVKELARAFDLGSDRVVWVEPGTDGGAVPHAAPVAAFRPLAELVAYTPPGAVRLTAAESRAEPFALPWAVVGEELPEPADTEHPPPGPPLPPRNLGRFASSGWLARLARRLRRPIRETVEDDDTEVLAETPAPPPAAPRERVQRKLDSADALLHGHARAARRHELEARLLADFPRLGPDDRAGRWAELAAVYGATGKPHDAAVCWVNAIWEAEPPPPGWLEQWFLCECRAAKLPPAARLDRWLSEPGRFESARVLAAFCTAAAHLSPPAELVAALPRVLAFLDTHADALPVRAAWLARFALTRLCDGDALGLARWRDRLLGRLRDRGPGLDLDSPSFLRFHGTASADRFQTAKDWLARARDPILGWVGKLGSGGRLQGAGIDAETESTAAYAQLMLAWGLGCLGEWTRSRDWTARARKVLLRAAAPGVDPAVHALLADAFAHRIRDAQEGRPARPGLPDELRDRLDGLVYFSRYAVDRFRDHSRILEPADRVRAFRGSDLRPFRGSDLLGERLHVLADQTDPAALADETRQLLALCAAEPSPGTVPRVALTLLELAPQLEESFIPGVLALLPPALDWMEAAVQAGPWHEDERPDHLPRYLARLLAAGFAAAAWFGHWSAVGPSVGYLSRRVAAGQHDLRQALELAAGSVFRSLRKLGFRAEAEGLLRTIDPGHGVAPGDRFPPPRLGLAVGWFAVGDEDAGNRILNEARERLFLAGSDDRERTELAIAYAEALGFAPPGIALGRLEEIFQRLERVSVTGSTNRYFTLKPLELIDAVVRSVVTEDFALGPSVRGWLDDDEFLIRRRIHRDLAAVLREQGIG
jgi:hypothetical protein